MRIALFFFILYVLTQTKTGFYYHVYCTTYYISSIVGCLFALCSCGTYQDTLLSGLLERNLNPAFSHIRGLKDIVECRQATRRIVFCSHLQFTSSPLQAESLALSCTHALVCDIF